MDYLHHGNQGFSILLLGTSMTFRTLTKVWSKKYPPELQSNKANATDNEAPNLDRHFSIAIGFVSSKNYDTR